MEIKGNIQSKTDNSIKLNNFWIKFFKPELLQGINAGDEVIVKYSDKTKDNKVYHNGTSIQLTSKEVFIYKIDNQLASILTSYVKDIIIANINNELDYNIETITNQVIKSFKQIKEI
jgi:hypothetical protein